MSRHVFILALASLTTAACLDAREGDAPQGTVAPPLTSGYGPTNPAVDPPDPADDEDCASTKAGCPPDPVEPDPVEPDPVEPDPVVECSPEGTVCQAATECCSGLCTIDGSGYSEGFCEPKRTGGQICFTGDQCVSGSCIDGACINAECNDLGDQCWNGNECCTGLCTWVAYAQGECTAPLPDGDPCWTDGMCAAGLCIDGICGDEVIPAPDCYDANATCYLNSECCSGVCTYNPMSPYVPGSCSTPLATGSACAEATDCASGACVSGTCIAESCTEVGATCKDHASCCTGLCSGNGETDGVCFVPRAAGSICCKDAACLSGICIDGACE